VPNFTFIGSTYHFWTTE